MMGADGNFRIFDRIVEEDAGKGCFDAAGDLAMGEGGWNFVRERIEDEISGGKGYQGVGDGTGVGFGAGEDEEKPVKGSFSNVLVLHG